jgi:hypothetical protein
MIRKAIHGTMLDLRRSAICAFALLLSLAALPALGQKVHQLSRNGSSWMDQNLNGAVAAP